LNADVEELAGIPGISHDTAERIQQLAYELKKKKDDGTLQIPDFSEEEEGLTLENVFAKPAVQAPEPVEALEGADVEEPGTDGPTPQG
jgi:Holliday junction resolvasome RuvABC DNA-binding subunit